MEKFDIFDIHTHLNVDDFVERGAEGLAFAKEVGVTRYNVVGFDALTTKRAIGLAEKSPEAHVIIGQYLTEAGSYNQETEDVVVANLPHPKAIGLGETGLDYHRMEGSRGVRMGVFKHQIQLSKDHSFLFTVHIRNALEDTYAVIREAGVGPRGGIIHSFSGSLETAERFIEPGIMISFSGIVTFRKVLDVQEVAQRLPLDKTLVETDAPYLAPVPKRGRENRTVYTRYVVDKIAELRGLVSKEVVKATSDNAKKLFNRD